MAGAGTAGRKREERKQSRTSESDRPEGKHEGPIVKDSSSGSKSKKGQPKREEERKAKERGGRIESGYSPDTSLVRGVGAL